MPEFVLSHSEYCATTQGQLNLTCLQFQPSRFLENRSRFTAKSPRKVTAPRKRNTSTIETKTIGCFPTSYNAYF